jgi:hypothetical protein
MDLQIIQVDEVTGVVTLGIPRVPRKITGLDKLTQVVALAILRNPGQDVLNPEEGTGFRDLIGQYNFTSVEELSAIISQRVSFVESSILASQPADADPNEKLSRMTVQDVAYDEAARGLYVRIRIINELDAESDIII